MVLCAANLKEILRRGKVSNIRTREIEHFALKIYVDTKLMANIESEAAQGFTLYEGARADEI